MTAAVLFNETTIHEPVSELRQKLLRWHIAILPDGEVEQCKRRKEQECKVGVWRTFHWFPRAYVRATDFVMMESGIGNISCSLIASFGIGGMMWGLLMLASGPMLAAYAATGAGVGFALSLLLYIAIKVGERMSTMNAFLVAGQYWQKIPFGKYAGSRNIPARIQSRIITVRKGLPRATVIIERFGSDPLVSVTFKGDTAYIGAWNTGTYLDNI